MQLNFPSNPTLNQQYTFGGYTWEWNGSYWAAIFNPELTGATGATGIVGATGPQGPQGPPNGATGATGESGATGITGNVGATGSTGIPGATGITGNVGATGAQGIQGVQGDLGSTGATGIGASGATGATGPLGSTGATGPMGTSLFLKGSYPNLTVLTSTILTGNIGDAYLLSQTGNIAIWTGNVWEDGGNVQGPRGATGSTGIGATGATGPLGPIGATGPSGGPTGATGVTGATGLQGLSAGLQTYFDTLTTPGRTSNGSVRFNNATVTSVSALYVNVTDRIGLAIGNILNAFNTTNNPQKGIIVVRGANVNSVTQTVFSVTNVSNNTSFYTINVNHLSGLSLPAAGENLVIQTAFSSNVGATGATGSIGATGLIGATGPAGGPIGATGSTGTIGATGARGLTGSTGATGIQGNIGATGPSGGFGGASFLYTYSTVTSNSDPGSATLKFNTNTLTTANVLYIDDEQSGPFDIQTYLRTIDDSNSQIKGHFRISNRLDAARFALYTIDSIAELTGYFVVNCNYVNGTITNFADLEDIVITFARTGDKGDPGATGATGIFSGSTNLAFITSNTLTANSTTSGALQVAGGAGIGGNLYVGGNIYAGRYFDSNGNPIVAGITVKSIWSNNGQPQVTVNNVTSLEFDDDSGFTVANRGSGNALVAMQSTFKYWEITGSEQLIAQGLDHITINSGNNIVITSNANATPYQSITFSTVSNPTFTGNTRVGNLISGNIAANSIYSTSNVYTGNLLTSTIYAGNYRLSDGSPFVSGGLYYKGNASPALPKPGDLWYETDGDILYVYINNDIDTFWLDISSAISGPAGATGPIGNIGATGATGVQGATGEVGLTGITGATGSTGPQGATGIGETGATGSTGPIGATGDPGGATGATGVTGATGQPGSPGGASGATGPQGVQGIQGIQGNVGATGATGLTGATGPRGLDGVAGTAGLTGATGPIGATGPAGGLGATGATGDPGLQGPPGDPGGATGATGPAGATGAAGPAGGATGATGDPGPPGDTGATGIDGATGSTGATGPLGSTGATGATGIVGGVIHNVFNNGTTEFLVNDVGNPELWLIKGYTYYFNISANGHPFWIKTSPTTGNANAYVTSGLTNNGIDFGTITFRVPHDAPTTLYYACADHTSMRGNITVSDKGPIGATGITGNIGATGPIGPQGIQGVQGIQGPLGATGATGLEGATGLTGATGNIGPIGTTGATGPEGATGPQGNIGPQGATGFFEGLTVSSVWTSNLEPKFTVSNVTSIQFDDDSGFAVSQNGNSVALIAMQSTFKYWHVTDSELLTAQGLDHITINSGNNIVITSNANGSPYQSITFSTVDNPSFGNITARGDVSISGNLYVANVLSVISSQLFISDPLVYFQSNTIYPYNYDIGFFSHYRGGESNAYIHTGFARSHENDYWGLFSNVHTEPQNAHIAWDDSGIRWDTLKTGDHIIATTTASGNTTSGALTVAGGVGIQGNLNVGGLVTVSSNILPISNETISIGSPTYRFKDLYLSGNTLSLGNTTISVQNDVLFVESITVNANVSTDNITSNSANIIGSASVGSLQVGNVATASRFYANTGAINADLYLGNFASFSNVNVAVALTTTKLYVGNILYPNGSPYLIGGGGGGGGGTSVLVSSTPPNNNTPGTLWVDDETAELSVFVGNAWVEVSASGYPGATGATGPLGNPGATGPQGDRGATGSTGLTGATGLGATGATGPMGPQGSPGGATGATGLTGATGPAGSVAALSLRYEGTELTNTVTSLNFTGGLNVTTFGSNVTVAVTGGGGGGAGGTLSSNSTIYDAQLVAWPIGYRILPPSSNTSGTLILADTGKMIYTTSNITVPPWTSVSFEVGTMITVINQANPIYIIQGTGVTMRLIGAGATGTRALAAYSMATLIKVAHSDTWYIGGSGVT